MTRILIPTMTKPDIPDINGCVYSKDVWRKCVLDIRSRAMIDNHSIRLTEDGYGGEYMMDFARRGLYIPPDVDMGHVSVLRDDYIIADIYDEYRYRKIINAIHNGDIKAYMNYLAKVDHAKDDAYSYATDIYIMYFALGPAIPVDVSKQSK